MLFVSIRQDMDVDRGRRASAASIFRVVPFLLSRYIPSGTNTREGESDYRIRFDEYQCVFPIRPDPRQQTP
jgi:hypothetical protein